MVPDDLIFNWDHTGIHLLPVHDWMMEKQGSKNMVIKGSDDKQQITVVLAATLTGCFMRPLILYEGKTDRCHPAVEGWDVSHTSNHWSNEVSMIQYLNNHNPSLSWLYSKDSKQTSLRICCVPIKFEWWWFQLIVPTSFNQ